MFIVQWGFLLYFMNYLDVSLKCFFVTFLSRYHMFNMIEVLNSDILFEATPILNWGLEMLIIGLMMSSCYNCVECLSCLPILTFTRFWKLLLRYGKEFQSKNQPFFTPYPRVFIWLSCNFCSHFLSLFCYFHLIAFNLPSLNDVITHILAIHYVNGIGSC